MVQLIIGEKGKGKTKYLLDKVNSEIQNVSGNIVYLDKSTKHMYELNNKIRLIDVSSYLVSSADEFAGFICGILSQDHDLQQVYIDSFLKIACVEENETEAILNKLSQIGEKFGVDFIISATVTEEQLSDTYKDKVIVSL